MAYCSRAQAVAEGADGTDDTALDQAIADAEATVNRYTGDVFEPTDMTVRADVAANGQVLLPMRTRAITTLTFIGAAAALPATAYRLHQGSEPGDVDAVELVPSGLYDDLVVGAERWNGGWQGLLDAPLNSFRQVEIIGSFGWDAPPRPVRRATARLAALYLPRQAEMAADAEGNPQQTPDPEATNAVQPSTPDVPQRGEKTTGDALADQLLNPYDRTRVLVS